MTSLIGLALAAMAAALAVASRRPSWIVHHPLVVLALLFGVSFAAAAALFQADPVGIDLQIDPSTEPLLPAGDPAQELYRRAVVDFGDDEVYVIAITCAEVFTPSCLSTIKGITDRVARLDGVRSVSSLLDVTSFHYEAESDWVVIQPFIEEVPTQAAELRILRFRALNDPVYRRTLVSDDSRAAAINVRFRRMTDAEFIAREFDERIRAIVEEEVGEEIGFHIAGRPHIKVHVYHGMLHDLGLLIPISIIAMALVLWIFTGGRRGVIIPLATASMANLWTFGAMAALDVSLNLLTGLLGPMLLALGSVYGVHVLSRYEEEAQTSADAVTAVQRCLEHVIVPVLIAGFTTVMGFGALLITDVPAVFELGAFSMFGVASATLIVATGVPALLVLLPLRALPRSAAAGTSGPRRLAIAIDHWLTWALTRLGEWVTHRTGAILWVSALIVIGSVIAIPRIQIDTDYLSYFDERDPLRLDFEAVNRLLAGAIPLYVVIEGGGPGTFREPQVLSALALLQERFDGVEGVSRTLSFLDTLRVLNRAFHADDPSEERIPETRKGVTELLFMIPKSQLQRFATVNHGKTNIIVRTGEVGSAAIQRLHASLDEVIADTPLPTGIEASVTGNAILLARSADGIARGQPQSVALAAVTIFLIIALGLGSPRLGGLAMIPNLVPVLVFFGLLGLGAAPLSLPTSLIGCVALGIAIDDTVHYLVRYR
ncbi:MAG: MMPL family transporter, partial [Myxococcota bacterium]